ncbi:MULTISPECIES: 7-carboxy-7-deazaguanine synthase QueE [unclassified Guyparkeria]|uniref:7-carboxy-7-deazaguanine synthase QueE n=1 Tax=unclassified Guyparkeria TaxID=2626246 RepID=UPI0007339518|nr:MULTISPECIES: 7-carboxy-7-deazaguanine synthase QueE [unclassified Guyparkeria]KTG17967.1 7-carboxy-7-deazaguanine synthase [Guyparkeria sp. XI15]OAE89677.1 7-carboxy-7-deazaguanine synthase [Guyparkeria sp. WRN-7]
MGDRSTRSLRITEIFRSLQGESDHIGWPTVFVRLTGCPLRCVYCDTAYAFTGGERMSPESILDRVAELDTRHVCVTGGEPLAQPGCIDLLRRLADADHEVSLETSGAMDVAEVDPRVHVVMDLKTPSSGEETRNRWENLAHLKSSDEIKVVIGSREDFDWAVARVREHDLTRRFAVLFSPVFEGVSPRTLAEWILDSGLDIRFQMQLHKLIWGDEPGR